jgi:hypothetical protein
MSGLDKVLIDLTSPVLMLVSLLAIALAMVVVSRRPAFRSEASYGSVDSRNEEPSQGLLTSSDDGRGAADRERFWPKEEFMRTPPMVAATKQQQQATEEQHRALLGAMACLLLFTYTSFANSAILLLNCVEIAGDKRVLMYAGSHECLLSWQWPVVLLVLLLSMLPVVPLAFWLKSSLRSRGQHQQPSVSKHAPYFVHALAHHAMQPFTSWHSHWAAVLLLQRTLTVLCSALATTGVEASVGVALISLLFLLLQLTFRPYRIKWVNHLQTSASVCLVLLAILNSASGAFISTGFDPLTDGNSSIAHFQLAIEGMMFVTLFPPLVTFVYHKIRWRRCRRPGVKDGERRSDDVGAEARAGDFDTAADSLGCASAGSGGRGGHASATCKGGYGRIARNDDWHTAQEERGRDLLGADADVDALQQLLVHQRKAHIDAIDRERCRHATEKGGLLAEIARLSAICSEGKQKQGSTTRKRGPVDTALRPVETAIQRGEEQARERHQEQREEEKRSAQGTEDSTDFQDFYLTPTSQDMSPMQPIRRNPEARLAASVLLGATEQPDTQVC